MTSRSRPERTYLDQTFLELGGGFQFASPPPADIHEARYFYSDDPWEVMGAALKRLQSGDFTAVEALPRVMAASNDALIWAGAMLLLGYAAPWPLLQSLAERVVARRDDPAMQLNAPAMLEASMGLWAVDPLLALLEPALPAGRAPLVQGCLSRLLEPDAGPIDDGPEEVREALPDYPEPFTEYRITHRADEFRAAVRARKEMLIGEFGTDLLAVAEGQVFSVESTALRLLERLRNEPDRSGRMDFERMRLEAATGLDCRAFYSPTGRLQRLPAMAVVEDFLESGQAAAFTPGRRYFFGHPIPG